MGMAGSLLCGHSHQLATQIARMVSEKHAQCLFKSIANASRAEPKGLRSLVHHFRRRSEGAGSDDLKDLKLLAIL